MIKLTNNTDGLLVYSLNSGDTLRLNKGKSRYIKKSDMTPYLSNLVEKGLLLREDIVESKTTVTTKKHNSKSDADNKKED